MQEAERVKLARAIKAQREEWEEELPMMMELFAFIAKKHKLKYDSLIKEGFTEAQALELCKTI